MSRMLARLARLEALLLLELVLVQTAQLDHTQILLKQAAASAIKAPIVMEVEVKSPALLEVIAKQVLVLKPLVQLDHIAAQVQLVLVANAKLEAIA